MKFFRRGATLPVSYTHLKVTDTFYAALFEDEELTTMATDYDGNKAMKAIEFNGESSKTVTIDNMPVGPTTHPVTYYVAEVDKDGTPVDNSFKYQATVTKGKISLDIKHLDVYKRQRRRGSVASEI